MPQLGLVFLALSILMLAAGPGISELVHRKRVGLGALDGFSLVAVGSLVLFHVLPHSIAEGGLGAVMLAAVGLIGPYAVERLGERASHGGHLLLTLVVVFGLLPHAVLDGMAVMAGSSQASPHPSAALPLAVVIHRLPAGLAVWWLVRPAYGMGQTVLTLAAMAAATCAGYAVGESYFGGLHSTGFALFEGLFCGSLLHVLLHRPHLEGPASREGRWRLSETAGAVAAVALLLGLPQSFGPVNGAATAASGRFVALALASAPALLLGYLMAGALAVFLPAASVAWLRRGPPLLQAVRGMAYGLPLPICSCGVVPVYQSLVVRAVPAAAAMAFLVATPELGIEAVLISVPLLGLRLTSARLACALAVSVAVGWWVGRQTGSGSVAGGELSTGSGTRSGLGGRLLDMVRTGLGDLVDDTGPWMLAGLAVAALLGPTPLGRWLQHVPGGLDVVLMAVVGMPLYVCASGATPLAAMLILKGLSPGAAIALLLTGPATNVTTFGVLSRLHGRAVAFRFAAAVVAVSVALGYAVNALFLFVPVRMPALAVGAGGAGWLAWACLAVLAAAFALSLLRQGPRAFVSSLFQMRPADGQERQ